MFWEIGEGGRGMGGWGGGGGGSTLDVDGDSGAGGGAWKFDMYHPLYVIEYFVFECDIRFWK